MKAPRTPVALRLGATGLEAIDKRAKRGKVGRSEMLRTLIAYAMQHMPEGWKP